MMAKQNPSFTHLLPADILNSNESIMLFFIGPINIESGYSKIVALFSIFIIRSQ